MYTAEHDGASIQDLNPIELHCIQLDGSEPRHLVTRDPGGGGPVEAFLVTRRPDERVPSLGRWEQTSDVTLHADAAQARRAAWDTAMRITRFRQGDGSYHRYLGGARLDDEPPPS